MEQVSEQSNNENIVSYRHSYILVYWKWGFVSHFHLKKKNVKVSRLNATHFLCFEISLAA